MNYPASLSSLSYKKELYLIDLKNPASFEIGEPLPYSLVKLSRMISILSGTV